MPAHSLFNCLPCRGFAPLLPYPLIPHTETLLFLCFQSNILLHNYCIIRGLCSGNKLGNNLETCFRFVSVSEFGNNGQVCFRFVSDIVSDHIPLIFRIFRAFRKHVSALSLVGIVSALFPSKAFITKRKRGGLYPPRPSVHNRLAVILRIEILIPPVSRF